MLLVILSRIALTGSPAVLSIVCRKDKPCLSLPAERDQKEELWFAASETNTLFY